MNSAQILTHPAFARPAVLNAVRRGPTPRNIPMLGRLRRQRSSECWLLRRWADEHGVETERGVYDYDKIRELKAQQEAREAAENGLYADELRDISGMKNTLVKLYAAVNMRERRIVEQTAREAVNRISRDMNLPVRYD